MMWSSSDVQACRNTCSQIDLMFHWFVSESSASLLSSGVEMKTVWTVGFPNHLIKQILKRNKEKAMNRRTVQSVEADRNTSSKIALMLRSFVAVRSASLIWSGVDMIVTQIWAFKFTVKEFMVSIVQLLQEKKVVWVIAEQLSLYKLLIYTLCSAALLCPAPLTATERL